MMSPLFVLFHLIHSPATPTYVFSLYLKLVEKRNEAVKHNFPFIVSNTFSKLTQIKHFQAHPLIKLWIKIDIVMIQTFLLLISASDNATIAQRKANNNLFLAILVPFQSHEWSHGLSKGDDSFPGYSCVPSHLGRGQDGGKVLQTGDASSWRL